MTFLHQKQSAIYSSTASSKLSNFKVKVREFLMQITAKNNLRIIIKFKLIEKTNFKRLIIYYIIK